MGFQGKLVKLSDRRVSLSSKQEREYMLCGPCEQRFGVWENHVSRVTKQVDGTFPALDTAEPVVMMGDDPMRRIVAIDRDVVVKFGLSVFWRGSIRKRPVVSLGGRDEEDFRRYLNGETAFPERARLSVELLKPSADKPIDQVMVLAADQRIDAYHRRSAFLLFGMCFMLCVGVGQTADDLLSFERTGLALMSDGEHQFRRVGADFASADVGGALKRYAWKPMGGSVTP